MKYRARCNKRSCQARRNLSKPLEQYVSRPRCHVIGCSGLMYIDKYRQSKGPHDMPPKCTDDACMWLESRMRDGGSYVPFHHVGQRGCSGYEAWKLRQAFRAKKQPAERSDEAPF